MARRLRDAGHLAYFAGGCVRDRLLGKDPKDYDIATSATPAEVLRIFPGANEVGAHFGVVIAKSHGHAVEIATFRTDGSYRDGRRPESVTYSSPEDDARRRDFTINGLFEDPENGDVIDYVGGRSDLEAGILRAIGTPAERFAEDSLRLLRALRFAVTLDFEIEPATWSAITDHADGLRRIAAERIRDEFSRIITLPARARALEMLVRSGLIHHFLPEIMALIGCEQPPEWHPEGDVFIHTKIMLAMLPAEAPLELCLAVLLHDIAKPPTQTRDADTGRIRFNGHEALGATMTRDILNRLRYPNQVIDDVSFMVSRHMQFMNVRHMRVATLKRFMAASTFPLELELHRVDCASSNGCLDNLDFVLAKRTEFASAPLIPTPLVTGRDLIELGLTPGPRFRELLDFLQTEQLEGRMNHRESALAWIKNQLSEGH
ncbi:MAG: CCA tRNA nucleotidyltransferase [Verrucomicrobia bacterium]|nr:MAG: CCA tRNA nucleotidyltransferase [Verrucomicrobiota bacterium]TAE86129.1 MAG: CCA tRNA nucleotidyltransferase [Verrucomicrobiota bacterium]TAF23476.1 MAG: CCA tRNA nucleotidyltransferase [Verrucomicrobiota bacterium]TAF40106.1 MAG: CCA tRNA nucleotidyltransferase [Verrucomicrobiota bacterium]